MFKPYDHFIYGEAWFIRLHERKLIPTQEALIEFLDDNEGKLYDKEYLIKMASTLPRFGLPTNANLMFEGEHYKKAFEHLEYLTTSSTVTTLYNGMSLNEDEFTKWIDVVSYYLLAIWFTEQDCVKLLIYSPIYFNPAALLHLTHPRTRFEGGFRKDIINTYFKQLDIPLSQCEDLANRISYYGLSRYVSVLDSYAFLDYFSAVEVVKRYTDKGDKKSIKLAGILIGLYFTPETIEKAIKH